MTAQQAQRYPLSWPLGWRRMSPVQRTRAAFGKGENYELAGALRTRRVKLTAADAVSRLAAELDRLGARDPILSTNMPTRVDGTPRSDLREPADPGAAVYFTFKKSPMALACDKWDRVADNIAALAQHIDALRRIERYGVGTLDQAFRGYAALPSGVKNWWDVLGLESTATIVEVEEAYRRLAKTAHPDAGGSHERMAELNAAREAARKALA